MRGSDLRYEAMEIAMSLAEEKLGRDWSALTEIEQAKLYAEAEEVQHDQCSAYFESCVDAAQDR
jgi:hypothetical protein